jgi:hypothetical protein
MLHTPHRYNFYYQPPPFRFYPPFHHHANQFCSLLNCFSPVFVHLATVSQTPSLALQELYSFVFLFRKTCFTFVLICYKESGFGRGAICANYVIDLLRRFRIAFAL